VEALGGGEEVRAGRHGRIGEMDMQCKRQQVKAGRCEVKEGKGWQQERG